MECVLVIASGLVLCSTYMVRTLLPYVTLELGGGGVDVSRVLYISFVVMALLPPVAGWLCDLAGFHRVLAVSAAASAVLIPCYLVVASVHQLLVLRVAHALAVGFTISSSLAAASWVTSRGGVGIGLLRLSQGLGIALGPVVAAALASIGYAAAFAAASAMCVATALAASTYRGEVPRSSGLPRLGLVARALGSWDIASLAALAASEVLGFTFLISYYSSHLVVELGVSEAEYASFLLVESVCFSLGSYASEKLYRRLGRPLPVAAGLGLALTYTALARFTDFHLILVLAGAVGLLSSMVLNPVYVEASSRLDPRVRGLGVNVVDLVVTAPSSLTPLAEPLVAWTGFSCSALLPATLIAAASLAAAFAGRRRVL